MTVYSKRATPAERKRLSDYEAATGFEALHQEDLDSGAMTFEDVARANVRWFEAFYADAMNGIPPIPEPE